MDIELSKIVVPALVGLASGVLGTFFAPWVNWGIEKKKLIREERKALIAECRKVLSEDISSYEFRVHPAYSKIRPYLSGAAIKAVEGEIGSHGEEVVVVDRGGRHGGVNPFRQRVLDELANQERVWALI